MWREFSFNGKYKWIDMFKQLINKYNNRIHRTIKMSPSKVDSSNEKQKEKGYTPNYTTEILKIRRIHTLKHTYLKILMVWNSKKLDSPTHT